MTPKGLISLPPSYGVNYSLGYIGFIHHLDPGLVSSGIAYFQGAPEPGDISVTHALVVTGDGVCSEAQASGVKEAPLDEYFNDPKVALVFRKPRGWHVGMGEIIAQDARSRDGEKYAYSLILAQALAKSKLGRLLNRWFQDKPDALVSRLLDFGNMEYCSEHAAKALQAVESLRNQGILSKPARTIDVQELFGSRAVFEDWKR